MPGPLLYTTRSISARLRPTSLSRRSSSLSSAATARRAAAFRLSARPRRESPERRRRLQPEARGRVRRSTIPWTSQRDCGVCISIEGFLSFMRGGGAVFGQDRIACAGRCRSIPTAVPAAETCPSDRANFGIADSGSSAGPGSHGLRFCKHGHDLRLDRRHGIERRRSRKVAKGEVT